MLAPSAHDMLLEAGLPVTGSGYWHLTFRANDGSEICVSIQDKKLWVTRHVPLAPPPTD